MIARLGCGVNQIAGTNRGTINQQMNSTDTSGTAGISSTKKVDSMRTMGSLLVRPNARAMLSGNANASEATVSTMVRNSPPHRFIGTASSSTALLTSATAQERLATSFSRGLAGSRKLA